MSFIAICITYAVAFATLMGTFKGLSFFFTKRIKAGYALELPTFLFGTAAVFGTVCFGVFAVLLFPFDTLVSKRIIGVTALALSAVFSTDKRLIKPAFQNGLLFVLCLLGTTLITPDAPLWDIPFGWALCIPLALVWLGFILMMTTLDRVMLFSFLTTSALIIGFALLSTTAFPFFPNIFNTLLLLLLLLLLGLVYHLKNNGCVILGRPAVIFVSYVLGYMGMTLIAKGKGTYAPIFVAYELFEILLAMGINFWVYKQLTPIQTPFLIEQALMKNIAVGKALRQVFLWCLAFAAVGLVAVMAPAGYILSFYLLTVLFLSGLYMQLKDWGKPKVKFRNLFSDIKNGVKTGIASFKAEIEQSSLKKNSTTPKKKGKKQERP